MEHDLKTWPEFFQAVKRGDKTFELRNNDRKFSVGDTLNLQEYDPGAFMGIGSYTGDSSRVLVTYIFDGSTFGGQYFGVKPGTVIMSIKLI